MAIRFLRNIKQWKDFSNLAPYPIVIEGELWDSTEHYFQFMRFKDINPTYAQRIRDAATPRQAKMISMEIADRPENWSKIRVELLREANIVKYNSYPRLAKLLLSTGNEELIEANPNDDFWGEGADGTGQNMMGRILMEIRENLRNS